MLKHSKIYVDAECAKELSGSANLGEVEVIDGVSTVKEFPVYVKHSRSGPIEVSIMSNNSELKVLTGAQMVKPNEPAVFMLRLEPDPEREEPLLAGLKAREHYRVG